MKKLLLIIALLLLPTLVIASEDNSIEKLEQLYRTKSEINAQIETLATKREALAKTQNKIENGICTKEDVRPDIQMTTEEEQLQYEKDIAELEHAIKLKEQEIENVDHFVDTYNRITSSETKNIDILIKEYATTPVPVKEGQTGNDFINPVEKGRLTSGFGYRKHPILKRTIFHNGIDLARGLGTPILASEDGIVIYAQHTSGYGNTLLLMHSNGYYTLYAHIMNKGFTVSKGDMVEKGQQIAKMGSTGLSTGPHLHFEIIKGTQRVNPVAYIK